MITWAAAVRLLEKIGHKPTLNELIAEHIMTLAEKRVHGFTVEEYSQEQIRELLYG